MQISELQNACEETRLSPSVLEAEGLKKQLDNFVKENHSKFPLNPKALGSLNSKSLKPLEKCWKSSSIIGVPSAYHLP